MRIVEGWFISFSNVPSTVLQGYGVVKKGYRHIVLTRYDKVSESFIYFETLYGGFKIGVLTIDQWHFIVNHATETFVITTNVNPTKMLLPRILTCVGAAKHLLGVNWPFVFTPWQLRSALLKKGIADKFSLNDFSNQE